MRPRRRAAVVLPRWFGPWTAAPIGVLVTAADLPNAFPYVIAIERLVAAGVPGGTGLLVLACYGLVYRLPCLLLLVVGTVHGDAVRSRLRAVHHRIGRERVVPRSIPAALGLLAAAAALVVIAARL